jgi:hypothetical protein
MPGLRPPQPNLLDDGQYLEIAADPQQASTAPLSPLYGESKAPNSRSVNGTSPAPSSGFA